MKHVPVELRGAAADGTGEARIDALQCVIVNDGIAVQGSASTMSAVEYLRSRNIAGTVIERVLLEPARRRARQ